MTLLQQVWASLFSTVCDVLPIAIIIASFQWFVLRRPVANLPRVIWGFGFVIAGLSLFLMGLELALFPLGQSMAEQLTLLPGGHLVPRPDGIAASLPWHAYYWTYAFGFAIGFSATIAEPALLAVALKAHEVSGGTISVWGLRVAVALGSGTGVMLGTLRIILGIPLPLLVIAGYCLVLVQTYFAPKEIVPLAYDSGGVTTSTVTVPLVAALGLGLAQHIPGRSPLADGFGMIALAVLFPMMTVMGYAQIAARVNARRTRPQEQSRTAPVTPVPPHAPTQPQPEQNSPLSPETAETCISN